MLTTAGDVDNLVSAMGIGGLQRIELRKQGKMILGHRVVSYRESLSR